MICHVIILVSVTFNLFVHTYQGILYHKYLPCIYVLLKDGRHRPKHVGEINTIQVFMHECLPLVGINRV
jgi:hypothetical protein